VRTAGSAKVRVYSPQYERHGWRSVHSIVDIVCDNTPFVVDSLKMALNAIDQSIHAVVHPTFSITRDAQGLLIAAESLVEQDNGEAPDSSDTARTELFIHIEIDRLTDDSQPARVYAAVSSVIDSIDAAVSDWPAMRARLLTAADDVKSAESIAGKVDAEEASALLRWLHEGNFTLLGYCVNSAEHGSGPVVSDRLGILRGSDSDAPPVPGPLADSNAKDVLIVTSSDVRSVIHRPGYYDYISVRQFAETGEFQREHIFVGHFTATVFHESLGDIPWLRLKLQRILERSPFTAESHSGRALVNALENLPRESIFHFDENELLQTGTAVSRAEERRRVSLFVHRERFGRFLSCLVLIPRSRFNTTARDRVQRILTTTFEAADCEFAVQFTSSRLARVNFVLRVDPSSCPDTIDVPALEEELNEVTRTWSDKLQEAINESVGEELGPVLAKRYVNAFKPDFQEHYTCRVAANDISRIEQLSKKQPVAINIYRPLEFDASHVKLRLYELGKPTSLSRTLKKLENMGLTVSEARPSRVDPAGGKPVWIHDFTASHAVENGLEVDAVADRFVEAFIEIDRGKSSDDALNRLVIGAALNWREVVALRTYSRYLLQTAAPFSQTYIRKTLSRNPEITRALVDLFHARFDPERHDSKAAATLQSQIESLLTNVASLDEDRILRSFLAVILATLRTNYYQHDKNGRPKSYVSIKLNPAAVPDLPAPRPKFEIFVYSPRVEGIHLRGGKIARGGLRWSDRREDFRTEVLGLVKAQTIKNSVIVPLGAKGGFVPKKIADATDRLAEGIACYKTFIRGLLDVTDNLVADAVVPPANVVRHDDDDPYLVVAADKGTASFSDIANEIAAEYNFWLGDGFASGGSVGYDHKAMGITARGAWESVKRHFREIQIDIQSTPFTVVGIGDMGGDVFGNGMLRSPHIRLIAAFNHAHIFVDPDPDPARSYKERSRLFTTRGSSWADYDPDTLSPGGGIYPRTAKSISLSPEACRALGIETRPMTPNEIISAVLRAPVDLLWNGGIGTYVKASTEAHGEVGDRTNDAVRIDADELRCQVIGEGGNLGFTQRGRIEFARRGGHVYTDSIDNSAGVDCSDHEVNIKILLNQIAAEGDITMKQRNALLADMTDAVAELVLQTNYYQTGALSMSTYQAPLMIDVHARLISALESDGRIVRDVDCLPDEVQIAELRESGAGFTAPEFSVLIGHVKLALYDSLLNSDLPDLPYFTRELLGYFPQQLRDQYSDRMPEHRLRREIIANIVANELVNWGGISLVFRLTQETGADVATIACAYYVARDVFNQCDFRRRVANLDNKVPARVQTELLLESRKLIERSIRWLLIARSRSMEISAVVNRYAGGIATLSAVLPEIAGADAVNLDDARNAEFSRVGVPEDLVRQVASFEALSVAFDVVEIAERSSVSVEVTAEVYFQLGTALNLHWIRERINELPRNDRWQTLARAALREDLNLQERQLTSSVIDQIEPTGSPDPGIVAWLRNYNTQVERCRGFIAALMNESHIDVAMLAAALRELRSLTMATDAPGGNDDSGIGESAQA
jgi:glutamate dehydrogenase